MRHVVILLLLAAAAAAAACDGKATASDPTGARRSGSSKEYESCAASSDCGDGLRCFQEACRRTARSNVGDYHAARGDRLIAKADVNGAIDAYAEAEARYEADHLGIPPELDCEYGAALAAAQSNHDKAELGARVLHRCLIGAPAGSALRDHALASLAELDEAGLEPSHLAVDKAADVYLSRAPATPATEKLKVTAAGDPPPAAATFTMITDRVAAGDLRSSMVSCWQHYADATKKTSLTVSLPMKAAYIDSGYDDEAGSFVVKLDPAAAGAAGPDADATACVRTVVEPVIAQIKGLREGFTTKLKITIE
jgi:hypothetical protein